MYIHTPASTHFHTAMKNNKKLPNKLEENYREYKKMMFINLLHQASLNSEFP